IIYYNYIFTHLLLPAFIYSSFLLLLKHIAFLTDTRTTVTFFSSFFIIITNTTSSSIRTRVLALLRYNNKKHKKSKQANASSLRFARCTFSVLLFLSSSSSSCHYQLPWQ